MVADIIVIDAGTFGLIIPYFEHQVVKSYIVSQSVGLERNEFERGYQYLIECYVFGVKGNHFLVRCCVDLDLVSLWGNTSQR